LISTPPVPDAAGMNKIDVEIAYVVKLRKQVEDTRA
jgi:hypothetical protein